MLPRPGLLEGRGLNKIPPLPALDENQDKATAPSLSSLPALAPNSSVPETARKPSGNYALVAAVAAFLTAVILFFRNRPTRKMSSDLRGENGRMRAAVFGKIPLPPFLCPFFPGGPQKKSGRKNARSIPRILAAHFFCHPSAQGRAEKWWQGNRGLGTTPPIPAR